MPDFEITVSGATVDPWLDPAYGQTPSRLNPRTGRSMSRIIGTVGVPVVITAAVGGISAPSDSALAGRLFVAEVHEAPVTPRPNCTIPTAGQSSVQRFTPAAAGHYLFSMTRTEGGAVFVHVDAVAP